MLPVVPSDGRSLQVAKASRPAPAAKASRPAPASKASRSAPVAKAARATVARGTTCGIQPSPLPAVPAYHAHAEQGASVERSAEPRSASRSAVASEAGGRHGRVATGSGPAKVDVSRHASSSKQVGMARGTACSIQPSPLPSVPDDHAHAEQDASAKRPAELISASRSAVPIEAKLKAPKGKSRKRKVRMIRQKDASDMASALRSNKSKYTTKDGPNGTFIGQRGTTEVREFCMCEPLPPLRAQQDWGVDAPLMIGSDFAGINSICLAFKMLNIPCAEVFVCDNNEACKRMLLHHFGDTKLFYSDITKRVASDVPSVDVYTSTFPCQPFSRIGKKLGVADTRGTLFGKSLEYIREKRPRVIVLENVADLFFRFRTTYNDICDMLEQMGYTLLNRSDPLTNTSDHGLPQNRKRLVLLGMCGEPVHPFEELPNLTEMVSLKALLQSNKTVRRRDVSASGRARIQQAKQKAIASGYGSKDVIITDIAASPSRWRSRVNIMPCITATRGMQHGFYISTTRSRMSTADMLAVHGFPLNFYDPVACGVSEAQFGHQLGNSISINVLMRKLPGLLWSAGLVRTRPDASQEYWASAVSALRERGQMVQARPHGR